MSFLSDVGDRLKKAVTPPKDNRNIARAIGAPFTAGLSLVVPNSVVDFGRKAIRYTGLAYQTAAFPVLPASTQKRIFGLTARESKNAEIGQKVFRGIYAAAAVVAVPTVVSSLAAGWKGAGAKAAAARNAATLRASPAVDPTTFGPTPLPDNYVALNPNATVVGQPSNFVEVARTDAGSLAASKAVAAATTKGSEGAGFLSRLKTKGLDVVETGLIVGGARILGGRGDGSDGGGVGGNSAPAPSGGGSSIAPSFTDAPTSAGSSGGDSDGAQTNLLIAVVVVAAIGAAWLMTRVKK